MTAQGQEIMNRLAILPPTNYGDYRFKRDIAATISSVIGKEKVERTLQRMTDLGMLVWSKTGRMAKVVDPEKTYCSKYETASSMELTPEEFVGDYFESEEAVIRKAHEIYRESDNLLMLARTLRNVAVLGYENAL